MINLSIEYMIIFCNFVVIGHAVKFNATKFLILKIIIKKSTTPWRRTWPNFSTTQARIQFATTRIDVNFFMLGSLTAAYIIIVNLINMRLKISMKTKKNLKLEIKHGLNIFGTY